MSIHDEIAAIKDEYIALTERELNLWVAIIEAKRAELAKVKQIHQAVTASNPTPGVTAATPPATGAPAATPSARLPSSLPSGAPVPPAPVTLPSPAPAATGAFSPSEEYRVPAPPAPVAPVPPAPVPPAPPQAAPQPPGQAPPPPQLGSPPSMPSDPEAVRLIRELTS